MLLNMHQSRRLRTLHWVALDTQGVGPSGSGQLQASEARMIL